MLRRFHQITTNIFFGIAITPEYGTFKHVAFAAVRHIDGFVFARRCDLAFLVCVWIAPFGLERGYSKEKMFAPTVGFLGDLLELVSICDGAAIRVT